MKDYLIIGKIVNTHGIKGEIKVIPLTDAIERYKKLKNIYIEKGNTLNEYIISGVKIANTFVLLKLNEIDTIENAQFLRDCYIKIKRQDAIKLPKNSFFVSDLIGMNVISDMGENLGTIKDVIETGANDVYIVDNDGDDLLIPGIKEVVKNVNVENNTMIVKLLEGLKDI